MVNTSDRPITVDGVRLDTLAWNIEKITRATAARRSADVMVPGVDGVISSLNDSLEPAMFGLDMWLRGTDANGAVPGVGTRTTMQDNLDELVHLFGVRHRLLEVRQTTAVSVERRAMAKVVDTITPDMNETGSSGRFTVGLTIPSGVWEDVTATDWSGATGEVTALQGATETIQDAVLVVTGNGATPRVTDQATGSYVDLGAILATGATWRINAATWSTRTGAGLTVASADATGTDAQATTKYGGSPNRAGFLALTPVRDAALRRVKITLSGATSVTIRARRKFAL